MYENKNAVPLNHESKAEDFYFYFFQSVSRANTVNMNAPPLISTQLCYWFYAY
jgi:hypothetical protein